MMLPDGRRQPGLRESRRAVPSLPAEGSRRAGPMRTGLATTARTCAFAACLAAGASPLFADALNIVDLRPNPGLAPLRYTNSPFRIPNYLAGEKWGTEGAAHQDIQVPLSPAESVRHIAVPNGFRVDLVAADPDIAKPICMTWDTRGRLWIAETVDYPNEQQPEGRGRDRIRICEDTDADGRADRFTVFAEQLSIPTGMVHAGGGLIVIEGGRTLLLRDLNGDGRADERRVLFSGWGMSDTHATASNLRYGFDHWIWGTVGYSGFDGEVGGRKVRFGMGVFRFKPDGSELEFIRSSNNNTWGLGLSETGIVFGSTANNNASWYMAIPNRYYEAVRGWSAARMETIADSQAFYPITPRVRQVDIHGRYTAAAGHALYTARQFPREYWNQVAFVTEPTGHLIGKFRLEGRGSDFTARNEHSFLASSDEWTAPIMAEVGPDGALWVIDWYNYIIQHNPTPAGFKTGRGNAYDTPLRDKSHGRIYRVSWTGGPLAPAPALESASPGDLVPVLRHDNLLWRLAAQRLLIERGSPAQFPALVALIRDHSLDAIGSNPGALHALWALHALGALRTVNPQDPAAPALAGVASEALRHPAPGVRRTAAMVHPRTAGALPLLLTVAESDPDPLVRLASLLTITEMPSSEGAGRRLYTLLTNGTTSGDPWLTDALTAAAAQHHEGFVLGSLMADRQPLSREATTVARTVVRHLASAAPEPALDALLAGIASRATPQAVAILDGLVEGWPEEKPPGIESTRRDTLVRILSGGAEPIAQRLLLLVQKWGKLDLFPEQRAEAARRLKARLDSNAEPESARIESARTWIRIADAPATLESIVTGINAQTTPALASGLLQAVSLSRIPSAAGILLNAWPSLTPAARRTAVATLLRRAEWSLALLDAVDAGRLQSGDIARDQWNQLRQHPESRVASRARSVQQSGRPGQTPAELDAAIQKLLPIAQSKGDPARGARVFETACAACHTVNGKGGRIGPDLTGIGAKPKAEFFIDILDPNRSVEANYRLWTATTTAGDTLAGRLDAETATSIELLDTTGQKHIVQRRELATLAASGQSLMPGGFEQLPAEDLAGLLEYLANAAH